MTTLAWNKEFALEQTAGDQELLDELLLLFKDSSADDFNQLQEGFAQQNSDAVLASAHSIKGAAASLGIEGIREVAKVIEESARSGNISGEMEAHITVLEKLLQELYGMID